MTTKTAKKANVTDAQKIVDELESKKRDLAAARANDEATMASVSYEAHTGDQSAAAKLETLRERALRRDLELQNIESAIAEAKRHVAAAQEAEALAERKRCAAEARVVIDRIDSLFASADTHFKQAFDALNAADGRIEELHRLGFDFPTAGQLRANIIYAFETAMMALPKYLWSELSRSGLRFLAPGHRRTFSQFWSQMSASLGREIATRLSEAKQKEVA